MRSGQGSRLKSITSAVISRHPDRAHTPCWSLKRAGLKRVDSSKKSSGSNGPPSLRMSFPESSKSSFLSGRACEGRRSCQRSQHTDSSFHGSTPFFRCIGRMIRGGIRHRLLRCRVSYTQPTWCRSRRRGQEPYRWSTRQTAPGSHGPSGGGMTAQTDTSREPAGLRAGACSGHSGYCSYREASRPVFR